MQTNYPGDVIPIPTYLLNDDELQDLIDRITEIAAECGMTEERDETAIMAMRHELAKRNGQIIIET